MCRVLPRRRADRICSQHGPLSDIIRQRNSNIPPNRLSHSPRVARADDAYRIQVPSAFGAGSPCSLLAAQNKNCSESGGHWNSPRIHSKQSRHERHTFRAAAGRVHPTGIKTLGLEFEPTARNAE